MDADGQRNILDVNFTQDEKVMNYNRRKHSRTKINITTRLRYRSVTSNGEEEILAKTKDLSMGGALLKLPDVSDVEEVRELDISIPNHAEHITTEGEIRWKSEQDDSFLIRVEFSSLTSSEREILKNYLDEHGTQGLTQKASLVRFQEFKTHLENNMGLSEADQEKLEGIPPGKLYVSSKAIGINPPDLAELIAEYLDVGYVSSLDQEIVDIQDLTEKFCRKNNIVPIRKMDGDRILVLSNPYRHVCHSVYSNYYGGEFDRFLITEPNNINNLFAGNGNETEESKIDDYQTPAGLFVLNPDTDVNMQGDHMAEMSRDIETQNLEEQKKRSQEDNVIRLVNKLLISAIQKGVSDIHIEPRRNNLIVRFRLDGVLKNKWELPKSLTKLIVTRIKIMADMDIAERRQPQDGGFRVLYKERRIDVRASVIPVNTGEKAVLRVLDKESIPLDLSGLGFKEKSTKLLKKSLNNTKGILYFTGPTGSGKTTTMYTCLKKLYQPQVNIQTVENPIEYNISGVNQMEINTKAGLDFASALRGILRQDPDILMVGEIRDRETLDIAAKAAMSGHLVLSTLHTNDAASTVNRILNIGLDPYYIAATTQIIVAQRLLRRLCSDCKKPVDNPDFYLDKYPVLEGMKPNLFEPVGCKNCEHTGYRGQMGVMECIPSTESFRDAVREEKGTDYLRKLMTDEMGLNTLRENAFHKVAEGKTSAEEALRVSMI